jgi:hypothetical protein
VYQLRIYTLRTAEALQDYATVHWPRHIVTDQDGHAAQGQLAQARMQHQAAGQAADHHLTARQCDGRQRQGHPSSGTPTR